jgi:etoposide-induced 2.4 mRNA
MLLCDAEERREHGNMSSWSRCTRSTHPQALTATMASRYTAPRRNPDDDRYRNLPTSYEYQSARASYPLFLSLPETLLAHVSFAWHGLLDACRWDTVFRLVYSDSEIRAHVYKSLLLNSLSLTSIWTFDLLLQPLVQDHPKWFHRNVGWFYKVLWLGPVVGVSLYLNVSK